MLAMVLIFQFLNGLFNCLSLHYEFADYHHELSTLKSFL